MYSAEYYTVISTKYYTILIMKKQNNTVAPLANRYKEKTNLHIVKCPNCKIDIASRMVIPRCKKCGGYIYE